MDPITENPSKWKETTAQPTSIGQDKDQQIIQALANITTILVDMKNENKTKQRETVEEIQVDNRMNKLNKDIIRTNKLSNNLSKQLDNIGFTEDREDNKNRNFLKVMMENITKLEQKIKQIENTVKDQNNTINENKKTIHELEEIIKYNKTNDNTDNSKPTVSKPATRNQTKYIPTAGISPGNGEHADPDMREELSYAKVTSRRYKPPINIPEQVIIENPEYENETNKNNDEIDTDELPTEEQIKFIEKSIEN